MAKPTAITKIKSNLNKNLRISISGGFFMEKLNGETFLGQFIKGVITTVAITLVCVLVFALVLSLTDLGDGGEEENPLG